MSEVLIHVLPVYHCDETTVSLRSSCSGSCLAPYDHDQIRAYRPRDQVSGKSEVPREADDCQDAEYFPTSRPLQELLLFVRHFRVKVIPPLIRYRYSYDISNTLQTNLAVESSRRRWNTRFMWNHHLLSPAFDLKEPNGRSRWVLPLIHGFMDQASSYNLSFT